MLKCVNKSNLGLDTRKKMNATNVETKVFPAKNSLNAFFATYVWKWYQLREKLSLQGLSTCHRNEITSRLINKNADRFFFIKEMRWDIDFVLANAQTNINKLFSQTTLCAVIRYMFDLVFELYCTSYRSNNEIKTKFTNPAISKYSDNHSLLIILHFGCK